MVGGGERGISEQKENVLMKMWYKRLIYVSYIIVLCYKNKYVIFIGVRGLLWRRRIYSITTPSQASAKTPGLLVF